MAAVAALTYYGARTFTRRAADERAANEAQSFTLQSARLANNDAFDGYIQILRFTDDPALNDKNASAERRIALMRQDLLLNVNKFASLSIATLSGDVLASTDPFIQSVRTDPAFVATRTGPNPANSDIVIATPGQHGYIEYSALLHEPSGVAWGVLVARADPDRLWGATLAATIDGGRNVIINNNGLFAAGVPAGLIGKPWQGSPLPNGAVRASIGGVDSICGLAVIGKGTQIDRGLSVASCMPVSLIQSEQARAMGKQGLVTLAGAVLASVLAVGVLKVFWRGPQRAPAVADDAVEPATAAGGMDAPLLSEPEQPATPTVIEPHVDANAAHVVAAPPPPPVVADVGALTLIEAYEDRNARLAERLRATVQARLLVAAAQAEEAFKLAATDAEAAGKLHRHALDELEQIRTAELRAVGQELHPALVRLGLPAALKALAKAHAETISVTLDIDATVDSLVTTPGRSMLPAPLRFALFRFATDAVRGFEAAGAGTCSIALGRRDEMVVLAVSGEAVAEAADLNASALAIEAHGGTVSSNREGDSSVLSATFVSPPIAEMPEGWVANLEFDEPDATGEMDAGEEDDDLGEEERASHIRTFAPPDESGDADDIGTGEAEEEVDLLQPPNLRIVELPSTSEAESPQRPPSGVVPIDAIHLGEALESFAMTPRSLDVDLDLELADGGDTLVPGLRATVFSLVEAIVAALDEVGAARCSLSVRQAAGEVLLSAISETDGRPFDAAPLKPFESEIEAFGGYLAVSRRDNAVSVTAEVTAVTLTGAPPEPESFEELLDGEAAADDETLAS